jgi:hypothetical protein
VLDFLEEWLEAVRFFDDGVKADLVGVGFADGILMDRKKNDPRGMIRFFQGASSGQTVHAGHGEIHDNQIRIKSFGFLNGVDAIDRFVDDERSLNLDGRSYDRADSLVVVNNQDALLHEFPAEA